MSSEHHPPPDDRELEDFLAGRHPVGRAYRAGTEQDTAPRELDDAILRMARAHAATTAQSSPRRPRWLQPLAIAATLALSLGVLMNIWREPTLREQVAPMQTGQPGAMPQEPAAPAPAPASSSSQSAISEPIEAPAPALAPADEPAPAADPAAESRRAEPFPGAGAGPALDDEAPSPTDRLSPSTAPAPAPEVGAAVPSRPSPDVRGLDRDRSGEASMPAPEQAARKAMADEAAVAGQAERAKEEVPSRDALIERARAALTRGDTDEARRQVAQLRRLYPETPLPEDLRRLESEGP